MLKFALMLAALGAVADSPESKPVDFAPPSRMSPPRLIALDLDYPASALRAGEQGATGFRVTVGANGRVSDCGITRSSGSAALDSATCRMLTLRARFVPARDASGQPVAGTVESAIEWKLPAPAATEG